MAALTWGGKASSVIFPHQDLHYFCSSHDKDGSSLVETSLHINKNKLLLLPQGCGFKTLSVPKSTFVDIWRSGH